MKAFWNRAKTGARRNRAGGGQAKKPLSGWFANWRRGEGERGFVEAGIAAGGALLVVGAVIGNGAVATVVDMSDGHTWLPGQDGRIVEVNPATGQPERRLIVAGEDSDLAIAQRDGSLIVTDETSGQLTSVDLTALVASGSRASDGDQLVLVGGGQVLLVDTDPGTVRAVDPLTLEDLGRPYRTSKIADAVIDDEGAVWVLTDDSQLTQLRYEADSGQFTTGTQRPVDGAGSESRLVPHAKGVTVFAPDAGAIVQVGAGKDKALTVPDLKGSVAPAERAPADLVPASAPTGGKVFMLSKDNLLEVNVGELGCTKPDAPAVFNSKVYVPCKGSGQVMVLDSNGKRAGADITVPGGGDPKFTMDEGRLFVTTKGDDRAVVVQSDGGTAVVNLGEKGVPEKSVSADPVINVPMTSAATSANPFPTISSKPSSHSVDRDGADQNRVDRNRGDDDRSRHDRSRHDRADRDRSQPDRGHAKDRNERPERNNRHDAPDTDQPENPDNPGNSDEPQGPNLPEGNDADAGTNPADDAGADPANQTPPADSAADGADADSAAGADPEADTAATGDSDSSSDATDSTASSDSSGTNDSDGTDDSSATDGTADSSGTDAADSKDSADGTDTAGGTDSADGTSEPPAEPATGLRATANSDGSLTISWTPPKEAPKSYTVATLDGKHSVTAAADATSAKLTGLECGTKVQVLVTANYDSDDASSSVTGTTAACPVDPADLKPTSLKASADLDSLTVTWKAPAEAASGYAVALEGGATKKVSASTTSAKFTGLACSKTYTVTVTASHASAADGSASASAKTKACPPKAAAATSVKATKASDSSVKVTWKAAKGGADEYLVKASGRGWVSAGKKTSVTIDSLPLGSYTFTVQTQLGSSTANSAASNKVVLAKKPGKPNNLDVTVNTELTPVEVGFEAHWDAAPANGSKITKYKVVASGAGTTETFYTSATSYSNRLRCFRQFLCEATGDVEKPISVSVTVSAINDVGEGPEISGSGTGYATSGPYSAMPDPTPKDGAAVVSAKVRPPELEDPAVGFSVSMASNRPAPWKNYSGTCTLYVKVGSTNPTSLKVPCDASGIVYNGAAPSKMSADVSAYMVTSGATKATSAKSTVTLPSRNNYPICKPNKQYCEVVTSFDPGQPDVTITPAPWQVPDVPNPPAFAAGLLLIGGAGLRRSIRKMRRTSLNLSPRNHQGNGETSR